MNAAVKDLDEKIEELRQDIEPHLLSVIKPKGVKITWNEMKDKWEGFFRKVSRDKYDEGGKLVKPAIMPVLKWIVANGGYNVHTKKHFEDWLEKYPDSVVAEHTKITIEPARMSQHDIVKKYLLSQGWSPTQWNFEKDKDGKFLRDER